MSAAPTPASDTAPDGVIDCAYETEMRELMERVMPMVFDYLRENDNPNAKCVKFLRPQDLHQAMDMTPPAESRGMEGVMDGIEKTIEYSVRTGSPMFLDKLYAGADPVGMVAEFLASMLNTNVHTFAVAPAFATMEVEMVRHLGGIMGLPETRDGIFCPGGSYSNLVSMVTARHKAFPHVRKEGWRPTDRPVCFTSEQSHYSLARAGMVLGLGFDNVVRVETDRRGRMVAADLRRKVEAAIAEGKTPFYVNATAGTTVMGGFDPFNEVAEIAEEHNMWMHVDGSWGGGAALSSTDKHLVDGIERADSITWNPHKGLGVPMQCSVLMTRRAGELEASNASNANYLFHPHPDAAYDLGDKTLQCGRKPDAFKLWLLWRRHGLRGFQERVDHALALSRSMEAKVRARDGFHLVVDEHMSTNVCFWYVPPRLRGGDAAAAGAGGAAAEGDGAELPAPFEELDALTPAIYEAMQREGNMLVNFNPLPDHGLPRFFRIVFNSPRVRDEHLDAVLDEIDRLGRDL